MTSSPAILTIDAGTSALKAVVYDIRGRVLDLATERYPHDAPQPGWAEADPESWWNALEAALDSLRSRGLDLQTIRAIGLTGQMHTAVLLDEAGNVLPPTILWLDRRAEAETAELAERLPLPPHQLCSTYTLPKLLWLARQRPDVLVRTRWLLWPKDYLRYRLTGRILSDVTESAGAALLDWQRRTWAVERLALVGLDPAVLPPLQPAGADAGPLLPDVAARLNLCPSARVITGAGDVIALLGSAPPKPGRMACSLGSSTMLSAPLAPYQTVEDPTNRLYVYPFLPRPVLNGVQSTSGASLTWAWQALYGDDRSLADALDAALAVTPGADGLFFLPFLAGERTPYWNDNLRGGFYGLNLSHKRPHLIRAVLEGVAYSLRRLLDIAEELGVPIDELALAGGGATVTGWPQIIADVCQRPVVIYTGQETVTRPLYALCAAALDLSTTFDEALARTFIERPEAIFPRSDLAARYDAIYATYRRMADFAAQL